MIKHPDFLKKLCSLTKKVLPLIEPAIKGKFLPDEIRDYPSLKYNEHGFPSISSYPSRIDVSQFFRLDYSTKKPIIDLKAFKEYTWLRNRFDSISEFSGYFRFPNKSLEEDKYYVFSAENFIESFIERYYYLHGTKFTFAKFSRIYRAVENYLHAEVLPFDIAIPILFLKFDMDNFKISDQISIRRISDEDHRARHKIKAYSPAILDSIYMAATHELVLKNYTSQRPSNAYNYFHFSDPQLFPTNIFETFFTILKLVTDHTSGYAQILIYPKGWADSPSGDVKYITGTVSKSYPHYFENFYWNNKSYPKIGIQQLNSIKKLFNKAVSQDHNKINIALKRFYKSMMRQEEEDIIIDLIIALELLLSDNEKNDISYKLSMRLTALICKYHKNRFNPIEVSNNIKKIYDYRSAVVHGSTPRAQKSREIKLPDNSTIPTVELAKLYLREILKIVISEPKHLDSKINDQLLLKK